MINAYTGILNGGGKEEGRREVGARVYRARIPYDRAAAIVFGPPTTSLAQREREGGRLRERIVFIIRCSTSDRSSGDTDISHQLALLESSL